jgi:hypothetical protein
MRKWGTHFPPLDATPSIAARRLAEIGEKLARILRKMPIL